MMKHAQNPTLSDIVSAEHFDIDGILSFLKSSRCFTPCEYLEAADHEIFGFDEYLESVVRRLLISLATNEEESDVLMELKDFFLETTKIVLTSSWYVTHKERFNKLFIAEQHRGSPGALDLPFDVVVKSKYDEKRMILEAVYIIAAARRHTLRVPTAEEFKERYGYLSAIVSEVEGTRLRQFIAWIKIAYTVYGFYQNQDYFLGLVPCLSEGKRGRDAGTAFRKRRVSYDTGGSVSLASLARILIIREENPDKQARSLPSTYSRALLRYTKGFYPSEDLPKWIFTKKPNSTQTKASNVQLAHLAHAAHLLAPAPPVVIKREPSVELLDTEESTAVPGKRRGGETIVYDHLDYPATKKRARVGTDVPVCSDARQPAYRRDACHPSEMDRYSWVYDPYSYMYTDPHHQIPPLPPGPRAASIFGPTYTHMINPYLTRSSVPMYYEPSLEHFDELLSAETIRPVGSAYLTGSTSSIKSTFSPTTQDRQDRRHHRGRRARETDVDTLLPSNDALTLDSAPATASAASTACMRPSASSSSALSASASPSASPLVRYTDALETRRTRIHSAQLQLGRTSDESGFNVAEARSMVAGYEQNRSYGDVRKVSEASTDTDNDSTSGDQLDNPADLSMYATAPTAQSLAYATAAPTGIALYDTLNTLRNDEKSNIAQFHQIPFHQSRFRIGRGVGSVHLLDELMQPGRLTSRELYNPDDSLGWGYN